MLCNLYDNLSLEPCTYTHTHTLCIIQVSAEKFWSNPSPKGSELTSELFVCLFFIFNSFSFQPPLIYIYVTVMVFWF